VIIVRPLRTDPIGEESSMRESWANEPVTFDSDDIEPGPLRRGAVRLPLFSAGGVVAIGVIVLSCVFLSDGDGTATNAKASHSRLTNSEHVDSVAFTSDGRRLAWSGMKGTVATLSLDEDGRVASISVLLIDEREIGKLVFSRDGALLAHACYDGSVRLWDTKTWSAQLIAAPSDVSNRPVAFAPDHRVLAVGGSDSAIRLWDLPGGKQRASLT
jgi:WD40 repeat protein